MLFTGQLYFSFTLFMFILFIQTMITTDQLINNINVMKRGTSVEPNTQNTLREHGAKQIPENTKRSSDIPLRLLIPKGS